MSGPTSFRLSQETYELLKKNRDFYNSLFDLQKNKETPLSPKATDAESRTESKLRDNGDVEVSLVLPVDNDADPENGRLYVRDTFVFDPSEKVLKSYQRSFENNGKGGDEWKGWLGKYESLPDSKGRGPTDAAVQRFAHRVARSYGRPVVDDDLNTLPEIKEAFKKESRLLTTTNQQVAELNAGLDFKIRDKLNYYNLAWRGDKLDVTLQLSVDDDAEAENGRILLRDKFTLDAKTLQVEGFERNWSLAPNAANDARMQAALRALQRMPAPSGEEAGAFIQSLLPAILPKGDPQASAVMALLGAGKSLPQGYRSSFSKRGKGDAEGLKSASQFSLEAMFVVAQEQVMKRHDESQGWLNFGGSVDQVKEKALIESLFKKAKEAAEKNPSASPFELFQGLGLSADESALRDRLVSDKLMLEMEALAHETDPVLRGKSFAILAQEKLLIDEGMGESALHLAEQLKKDPATQRVGEEIAAIVQGKGNFGQKVGYILPLFAKEVSKPSMLLGMAAAPFLGTAFELGGLKLASWAYDTKKLSDIGRGAKLGAAVLGMSGEAIGFTAIHRGFERLHHGGDKAWNGAWQEIVSATLMFGGMRLTHWGSGMATARMAEGAWGSRLGYRFGESSFAGSMGRSPTGRFFFDAAASAAGKGIPTLTTSGKVVSGTMNHLGGILTMQASGALSRKLGLAPDNDQSFGANFFDATVMYAQAMVGSHAANMASGGSLHRNLGEFKMGVENLKKGIPVTPAVPATPSQTADPAQSGEAPTPPALPAAAEPQTAVAPKGEAPASGKLGFIERLRALRGRSGETKGSKAPVPSAVETKDSKPASKKPPLFDRLFAGREGRTKAAFEAAGEWFRNLSPSKLKALQAELEAARAKLAEVEQGSEEKGRTIGDLQGQLTTLEGQNEAAQRDLEAKGREIEALKTSLGETQGKQQAAETLAQEKGSALQTAETRLQELEAKKAEAEAKLQEFTEKAEMSELDLGVGSLEEQIEAHRAELGKLRAEKSKAEVDAGAYKLAADELRQQLSTAEQELQRRAGVDKALKESEAHVSELSAELSALKGSLEGLRQQVGELTAKDQGAIRLSADQAQKISELETLKKEVEGKLSEALEQIATLRKEVGDRDAELKTLTGRLEDVESELSTAKHRVESQENSIENLRKVKERLESQKSQTEAALAQEMGDKSVLQAKLEETEKGLKEANQEQSRLKHQLEISNAGKKGLQEEADRLRTRLEEAQAKRAKSEAELQKSIRSLEGQVQSHAEALESAKNTAVQLQQSLDAETGRANAAEAGVAELQQQKTALETEHEKTKTELRRAEIKLESLKREIDSKAAEIGRHKGSIDTFKKQIDGLRNKKTELEESLRKLRVEDTLKGKELESLRAELEAERAKEPEVIRDMTAEVELQSKIDELEAEKEKRDQYVAQLEGAKAGLETKSLELEAGKRDLEGQLRSKEADLDIASGAAKSAAEDLALQKQRYDAEEARLKKSIEDWRTKTATAESGKATAEARVVELEKEISEKRDRIEALEREGSSKSEQLKNLESARNVLEGDIERLESDLVEQTGLKEAKTAQLEQVSSELKEQIRALEAEKTSLSQDLGRRLAEISDLNENIASLREKVAGVEKYLQASRESARTERTALLEEKASLLADIEAKERDLRQKESDLINRQARVEELEADLQAARSSIEEIKGDFEKEKAKLEAIVAQHEAAISDLRSKLQESTHEASGLKRSLEGIRAELEKEKSAAKEWKGKFEGLEATSKAEAGRLRREAEELRKAERDALQKAGEASDKVAVLEAALESLQKENETSEADLGRRLGLAEQKAGREEKRANEAAGELEKARAEFHSQSETLRQEALEAGKKASLAEAKAKELEASLETERAAIRELQGDLEAAKAEAEALLAPASLKAEAEQRASDAANQAKQLSEGLRVAEEGKRAAEERVQALEKELAALRANTEQEAERLKTEAAGHRAAAEAAEERASAAGLRIIALEADLNAERIKTAALGSDATGKVEAEAKLSGLRKEIEELNGKIVAAEQRAGEAERRAAELQGNLTASEESAGRLAQELESLKQKQKSAEGDLISLREKVANLEPRLREATQKRSEAEGQLLGAQTRATEAERQLEIKNSEVAAKQGELEAAQAEYAKLWGESQGSGREAQAKIAGMESQLAELRNAQEGLAETIEIEREKVAQAERTHELLLESERALQEEVNALKAERNFANSRARELQNALEAKDAELKGVQVSLENQQPGGFRYPHQLFGGADPRANRVEARVQATALIGDKSGQVIGESHICAGGEEGIMQLKFADGSRASGRTSMGNVPNGGNGRRKFQEDSILLGRYTLPNGLEVKVLAGADGAGGMGSPGSGAVASSAFLQGTHARVVEAAREGRVPTAQELFEAGVKAVEIQRQQPDRPGMEEATGAGAVIVIVGNEAMVASAGDATVFLGRPDAQGQYEIVGYSNVGIIPINLDGRGWRYNNLSRGIHHYEPSLYRVTLQPGDRFLIASDGFHENTTGVAYKQNGSRESRQIQGFRPPTQEVFAAVRAAFKATRGQADSASKLHDLALENVKQPGRRVVLEGEEIQLPAVADRDNVFVVDYEHGEAGSSTYEVPLNYSPLEPVPTADQISAAEAAAERSTAKGFKLSVPESGATPKYQPRISDRSIADFHLKFVDDLAKLYGANADKASQALLELYVTFPELEEVINPSLLARAEDKQKQATLFDAAKKKVALRADLAADVLKSAEAELEKLKSVQRPYSTPDVADVQVIWDNYQGVLQRAFGEEAQKAAEIYAGILKNFPKVEADLGPSALGQIEPADFEKFFKRKLRPSLHRDRYRFNEGVAADAAFTSSQTLHDLYQAKTTVEYRQASGWISAKAIESGLREWSLEPKVEYIVGKNGEASIRIPDNSVSRRHFKLTPRGGRWVIQDLGSTYGTFVNGQQIQQAQLKAGDRITVGVDVELQVQVDENTQAVRLVELPKKPGAGLPGQAEASLGQDGALQIKIGRGRPVYVGRQQIADAFLSPNHFELIYKGNGWVIRDMGSDTGTQLNGVDIQKGVGPATQKRALGDFHPIKNGDHVHVGNLTFRFHETTDHAYLIQVAGQAVPPSSHGLRSPPPPLAQLRLEDGANYPLRNRTGQEVGEIFWDGDERGVGEFVLREVTHHGQVWVLNGNSYEPLGGHAYAMADGLMFGLGQKPEQSQWYLFKDGVVTAIHNGARAATPAAAPAMKVIEYAPQAQPIKLGRKELGGSSHISTTHLEFTFHQNAWWVRDLGSSNGTFQNNQLISKGKGVEGEWTRLSPNDVLSMGEARFYFRLRADGGMRLEQIPAPASPSPMEPIPVSIPPSYVPPQAAQAFGPPSIVGNGMKFGWARIIRIIEGKGETGLRPTSTEEAAPREYVLNIANGGFLRNLFFDKDLARIEDLGEGRFRVENIGFKQGMKITNAATGKNIQVALGRNDFARPGDTVELGDQKITLHP